MTETTTTATTAPGPETQERMASLEDFHRHVWCKSEKAAIIPDPHATDRHRIVAYQWGADPNAGVPDDYTYTRPTEGGVERPHLEGGRLHYELLLALHNRQENAVEPTIIERSYATHTRPTFVYGKQVNATTKEITAHGQSGLIDYRSYQQQRRNATYNIALEFAANWTALHDMRSIFSLDRRDTDHRVALWYALGMNWLLALAHPGNYNLPTEKVVLMRNQSVRTFEDFYENLAIGQADSKSRVRDVAHGIAFYSLSAATDGTLTLVSDPDIKCVRNYAHKWAQSILFRHPAHLLTHLDELHARHGNY